MYCIDVNKLKSKAIEKGTTFEGLALDLDIDRTTFYRRIRSCTLRIGDIHKLIEVLDLSSKETIEIFLSQKVA